MQKQLVPAAQDAVDRASAAWLLRLVQRLAAWAAATTASFFDAYAAASLYDDLARLSDAELTRRGMSRADICRFVAEAATEHARDDGRDSAG
jgi:hypothetical protein